MSSGLDRCRVILVEDDARLARMVADFLEQQEFEVGIENRGDQAVARIIDENPDVVILDVNLPGKDGFEVCKLVRLDYHGAIIMLTARGDEIDEVVGLEVGADDYMSKPVRPRALLARIRAHLRRAPSEASGPKDQFVQIGGLELDPSRRSAKLCDQSLDLTTAEYDLLLLLAQNAGETLSRHDIYRKIHGMNYDGLDRSIDLRISRLRKKLGDDPVKPNRIISVRGVGYLLSMEQ